MSVKDQHRRRVVITGVGLISPIGSTTDEVWASLRSGQSGVRELQRNSAEVLPAPFGAECLKFDGKIDDFGPLDKQRTKAIRKGIKLMCRETQMGVASAQRAIADAQLPQGTHDPQRIGVVFGSDYMLTMPLDYADAVGSCRRDQGDFDFTQWGNAGLGGMSPLWLLKYLPNMPASHIAIFNDLRGPNNSLTMRESAGNLAIGEAVQSIRRGHADCMVAGATGTRLHPMKSIHAVQQEPIATARPGQLPSTISRPFDRDRTGMVLGEAAAAVVLEELDAAQSHNATIYGEVVGCGSGFAADSDLRGDISRALRTAMRNALRDSALQPSQIGHIHAHGLANKRGDEQEAAAMCDVFADVKDDVPVVAAKSYFGNLGAASGVVELITSLLALQSGTLFPTLNYEQPDPNCAITVNSSTETPAGENTLNLSYTPQGQASALIVARGKPLFT